MGADAHKKGKIYYSMGEVAEMFDVNQSLIRFWESKFDILKPHKNKKGNRMFTPEDVDNLKLIYHLVKEKGMTLAGAQKRIKNNPEGVSRDMEVIDRLLRIKAILLELRQELKMDDGEVYRDDDTEEDILIPTVALEDKTENVESDDILLLGAEIDWLGDGSDENTTGFSVSDDNDELSGYEVSESFEMDEGHDMYVENMENDEQKPRIIEQTLF